MVLYRKFDKDLPAAPDMQNRHGIVNCKYSLTDGLQVNISILCIAPI